MGSGEARRQGCRPGAAPAAACGSGAAPASTAQGVPTLHPELEVAEPMPPLHVMLERNADRGIPSRMCFALAQQKAASAASGLSPPSTANTSLVTTPSLTSEDAMSEEAVLGPRLTNAQRKNLRRAPWAAAADNA